MIVRPKVLTVGINFKVSDNVHNCAQPITYIQSSSCQQMNSCLQPITYVQNTPCQQMQSCIQPMTCECVGNISTPNLCISDASINLLDARMNLSDASINLLDASINLLNINNITNCCHISSLDSRILTNTEQIHVLDQRITEIENMDFTGIGTEIPQNITESLDALENFKTSQEQYNLTNDINLLGKQNIINVNNKLPINNVDLTGSNLIHVDITSSLSTKLTNLTNKDLLQDDQIDSVKASIQVLEAADVHHTNLFYAINSHINDLRDTKQNNINSTNLLSSEFI